MARISGSAVKALFVALAVASLGLAGAIAPAEADGAVIPGVPTQVLTSNATESSIDVSWVAPASNGGAAISDYKIEYAKVGDLSWTLFVRDPSTATTATVTGLSGASTYAFRVAAVNTAGVSGWSRQESTVDAGDNHSCAVMANGTVQCWGGNTVGQLGNNLTTDSSVPVSVSGIDGLLASSTAVSVSASYQHSCALMANGSVRCWGWNLYGQLGNNSDSDSSVPVSVSGIDGATLASTAVQVSPMP